MRKTWSSSKTSWTIALSFAGAREVGPERLLHARPATAPRAPPLDHLDHVGGGERGHAEVVEDVRIAAEPNLGALDGRGQALGARRMIDVGEPGDERIDRLGVD